MAAKPAWMKAVGNSITEFDRCHAITDRRDFAGTV
jgi:hypothetical protein